MHHFGALVWTGTSSQLIYSQTRLTGATQKFRPHMHLLKYSVVVKETDVVRLLFLLLRSGCMLRKMPAYPVDLIAVKEAYFTNLDQYHIAIQMSQKIEQLPSVKSF